MPVPDIDISRYDDYEQAYSEFEWNLPETFNIAEAVCGQWAMAPDGKRRVALFYEREDGTRETYTFWQVQRTANRVANALESLGVERGDRVGIILPQRPETLFANLGVLQMGATAVPLSVLYGTDGLRYRLDHSDTTVAIVDEKRAETLSELEPKLDDLETVVTLGDIDALDDISGHRWEETVASASPEYDTVATGIDESAYIIYTSGTTGTPKGAHHAHRKLIGYVPGWQILNDFPGEGAVHFTPAGWSWVGGLFAVVFSAWFHGQPVVGYGGQFDPADTYELLETYGVTNPLLTSTMIRMMMEEDHEAYDLDVDVVASGGEKVAPDLHEYVREEWGATLNEIYGMTECNFVVVTNDEFVGRNWEASGRPVPGHRVKVIDDETGEVLDDGEIGHIAVERPDPSMLLEYWNEPERTHETFVGDWMKTGDAGSRDADGFIHYQGRADDVIITSGYRVSPLEVEEVIREHESITDAVVVGVDHETRGTVIKSFLKPAAGVSGSSELADEVKALVRDREAAYKYPREVEFVSEFPTTVSGKIQRHKLGEETGGSDE
jgi:acetyl-CoA synthetase